MGNKRLNIMRLNCCKDSIFKCTIFESLPIWRLGQISNLTDTIIATEKTSCAEFKTHRVAYLRSESISFYITSEYKDYLCQK